MGPVHLIWDATENKKVNGTVIAMSEFFHVTFLYFFEKKASACGSPKDCSMGFKM